MAGPAKVLPRTFAVVTGPPGSKLAVVVNRPGAGPGQAVAGASAIERCSSQVSRVRTAVPVLPFGV